MPSTQLKQRTKKQQQQQKGLAFILLHKQDPNLWDDFFSGTNQKFMEMCKFLSSLELFIRLEGTKGFQPVFCSMCNLYIGTGFSFRFPAYNISANFWILNTSSHSTHSLFVLASSKSTTSPGLGTNFSHLLPTPSLAANCISFLQHVAKIWYPISRWLQRRLKASKHFLCASAVI